MLFGIGICGACGACLRYALGNWIRRVYRGYFPFATLLINGLGSLALGILLALTENGVMSLWLWNLLGIGFLGAFTTFSTFSYEMITLWLAKKYRFAVIYILLSLFLGFFLALIGYQLFRSVQFT